MGVRRLAIYVTFWEASETCEAFAVAEQDDGTSDLWNDTLCSSARMPSVLAEWYTEWRRELTVGPSPSTAPSSGTV